MGIAWGRTFLYFLLVAAVGYGISFFTDAKRDETGTVTQSGTQTFSQLRVGDCIERTNSDGPNPSDEGDSSFNVVPCEQSHIWEVFGLMDLSISAYDEDLIREEASSFCQGQFLDYVGIDASYSSLRYEWYHPTQETWITGDRNITCITAFDDKSMTTGSFRNYGG